MRKIGINYRLKRVLSAVVCLVFSAGLCSCFKPSLYKKTYVICGTYLEITSSYKEAPAIVYEEFKRLDKIFNFYNSDSEISRLNSTYDKPLKVSPEMIEILQLSRAVYDITEGGFDISGGALYSFWKDLIKKGKVETLPPKEEIDKLKSMYGMQYIEINPQENTVLIKKEGLKIDLGGIAEGYMVDKAVSKLRQKGVDSAIINAGGDIYCLGTNNGLPWRIGIKDPVELQGIIETQNLSDEAITTSGNYEQFFQIQGKRYTHIIDPLSGYPVDNNILSVSVITQNCTTADSLATGFFVMGLERVQKFLVKQPHTMRVFIVTQEGDGKRIHVF